MKKFILVLLFPFFGYSQIPDEIKHAYGGLIIQQVSYHTVNKNVFNTRFKSLVFSYVFTNVLIQGKEIYDVYKPNKTGYSVKDVLFGNHGCNVGTIIQICANDYNKRTDYIDEQRYQFYQNKNNIIDTLQHDTLTRRKIR